MANPSILSYRYVAHLEGCDGATVYRRLAAGEYVACKTGREFRNSRTGRIEKEIGIPYWCLSEAGQARLVAERPELAKILKLAR